MEIMGEMLFLSEVVTYEDPPYFTGWDKRYD
jgi:hypothetical protein